MVHNYDTTSEELKPCPFCGGAPVWHIRGAVHEGKRTLIVKCQKCGTEQRTGTIRLSTAWLIQTAKDKWNSRTKKKFDIPGYENVIIHEGNAKGGILKDAQGDELPDYDREVVVLIQDYSDDEEHLRVAFGHRPKPNGYVTIDGEKIYPMTYGKGGWNGKNVRYWLDVKLPNQDEL